MWKRKTLKQQALNSLKRSYQRMIAVCFLVALLTTAYPSSTVVFHQFRPGFQTTTIQANPDTAETAESNSDIISQSVRQILGIYIPSTPFSNIVEHTIDFYTSGRSVLFATLKTINEIMLDPFSLSAFLLFVGMLVSILYHIFFDTLLRVGEARFFLESRIYGRTRISKIFFLYKLNYVCRPAWVMVCRTLCQWLWNLTVIGGIIKYYEYSMIPFLLAENPSMGRKNAFFLSRELMRGNKWRMFLLHLSFLGWDVLALFSVGILDFLLVNPYKTGANAELYMELRRNYILSRKARYELFNDPLLESELSEDELLIQKALYDDSEGPYTKISYFEPEQYPVFLYPIQPPVRAVRSSLDPVLNYDLVSCLSLFFVFSILGWVLESLSYLTLDGVFINRSFLLGPWIPLYGLCGILILKLCRSFVQKPLPVFLLSAVLYSAVSYLFDFISGLIGNRSVQERLHYFSAIGVQPFIADAFFFGLIGCVCLYYIAPRWKQLTRKVPSWILVCSGLLLFALLATDFLLAVSR